MPKKILITKRDFETGYKRIFIPLKIDELEKLVELAEFQEPAKLATIYVRQRIKLEYSKAGKQLPGQQNMFTKKKKGLIKNDNKN